MHRNDLPPAWPCGSTLRPLFVSLALLLPLGSQAAGDIIQIPLSKQGDSAVERPSKGMNKAAVESKFGAPESTQGPVGTPPITRWHYPAFVVTFEHDHVVHTVLKHKPIATPAESEAAPAQEQENNNEPIPTEPATPTP